MSQMNLSFQEKQLTVWVVKDKIQSFKLNIGKNLYLPPWACQFLSIFKDFSDDIRDDTKEFDFWFSIIASGNSVQEKATLGGAGLEDKISHSCMKGIKHHLDPSYLLPNRTKPLSCHREEGKDHWERPTSEVQGHRKYWVTSNNLVYLFIYANISWVYYHYI